MFPVYSIKLWLPSYFVRCSVSKRLKHVILEIQIDEKLAVLGCGIIWFQTYSLRNVGGHLVFFFIRQYFSSESFRGLLKTRQVLAEPGWNQGSFYGWFLLLPTGGSWHTQTLSSVRPSLTFPHCFPLSYMVPPSYTSIPVIFFAPGSFLLHPSFLSFKISVFLKAGNRFHSP